MRVFVTESDEVLSKITEEIPEEKMITIIKKHGDRDNIEIKAVSKNAEISFKSQNISLRNVLEIVADLGYEYATIKNFDEFEIKKCTDYTVVSNIQDLSKCEEFETLKSLIQKVKGSESSDRCGAIGVFIGFVRRISDEKESREVLRLEYEAYSDIFDYKLREIEDILKNYDGVEEVKIYHRKGTLHPGEDIVYVVVMGRHRKDIWRPLTESMEIVKKELPIWKKEIYVDGEIWIHDLHTQQNPE